MKVRFLQERTVQDAHANTSRATTFEKGRTYDLSEASANHWITRGVAVEVADAKKSAEGKEPKGDDPEGKGDDKK